MTTPATLEAAPGAFDQYGAELLALVVLLIETAEQERPAPDLEKSLSILGPGTAAGESSRGRYTPLKKWGGGK